MTFCERRKRRIDTNDHLKYSQDNTTPINATYNNLCNLPGSLEVKRSQNNNTKVWQIPRYYDLA